MVNPKSGTVATIPRPKLLNPSGGNAEQPKQFHFAVTWQTLLAHPQPVEITETIPTAPAAVLALMDVASHEAPSHALQIVEPPPRPRKDEAAWEMVVPKMVRRQL
jgi:hypothetical protein